MFVLVTDEAGNLTKHNTCFEFPTVGEQLTQAGVDWAYYSAVPGQPGYFWNAYNGVANVFHTDLWAEHIRSVDTLLDDIDANALPPVTWVTPRFQLSDHPPFSTGHAHNWVTKIVNKVMRSDMWEHTAIFLTWDEWGGFYDPVVPPSVDHLGLGIRVPLLTISPYTRRGVIDDERGEFSTPLRFISDNWGLEPLTDRIRNTHNFEHVFDFGGPPRAPELGREQAPTFSHSPWSVPGAIPTRAGSRGRCRWRTRSSPLDRPAAIRVPPDPALLGANDIGIAGIEREDHLELARAAGLRLLDPFALHAAHLPCSAGSVACGSRPVARRIVSQAYPLDESCMPCLPSRAMTGITSRV